MTSQRIGNNVICRHVSFPKFTWSEKFLFFLKETLPQISVIPPTRLREQLHTPPHSVERKVSGTTNWNQILKGTTRTNPTGPGTSGCSELFWNLPQLGHSDLCCLCTLSVYVTQSTHHPSDLLPTAMCDFYPAFSKCPYHLFLQSRMHWSPDVFFGYHCPWSPGGWRSFL